MKMCYEFNKGLAQGESPRIFRRPFSLSQAGVAF